MLTKDEVTLIDNYLEDNLTQAEKQLFKERFEANPEFARQIKQYTNLRIALRSAAKYRTQQVQEKPRAKKIKMSYYFMAIAASIVILIGITLYLNGYFSPPGPYDNLYANFYQNPADINADIVVRSDESEADKLAKDKFIEAINLMENKEFAEAIIILEDLQTRSSSILYDEINWYLALAYLRTEQVEKATPIFIDLFNSGSKFSEESFEIYNEINSIKNQQKN
jgi:hypothetical protein